MRELKLALDKVPAKLNTFKVVINAQRKRKNDHEVRYNQPRSNEFALVIIG